MCVMQKKVKRFTKLQGALFFYDKALKNLGKHPSLRDFQ